MSKPGVRRRLNFFYCRVLARIRSVCRNGEEWYFSIVDVIDVLTDSTNPTDYLKKLRKRDVLLGECIGTNCPQIAINICKEKIQLFEKQQVRSSWDEDSGQWWFSLLEIIVILTDQSDSKRARIYWRWLKYNLKAEGSG